MQAEEIEKRNILVFDSKALNGLRGVAAAHILLFHSLWYSNKSFNIYGQVFAFVTHRPENCDHSLLVDHLVSHELSLSDF